MAVTIHGEILNVQVKQKKVSVRGMNEAGRSEVYEMVQKIGRLTLEFDGDSVDVTQLAKFITAAPVRIELENTQGRMFGDNA